MKLWWLMMRLWVAAGVCRPPARSPRSRPLQTLLAEPGGERVERSGRAVRRSEVAGESDVCVLCTALNVRVHMASAVVARLLKNVSI